MNRRNDNFTRLVVVIGLLGGPMVAQSATDPSLILHSVEIHPACHEFRAVYSKNFEGCVDMVDEARNNITKTETEGYTYYHDIFCGSGERITVTDSLSRLNYLSLSHEGLLYLKNREGSPIIESDGVPLTEEHFCQVSLHSVTVDTCLQTFTAKYSKNFRTCGHIKEYVPGSAPQIVHYYNHFCTMGDNVERTVKLSDMTVLPPYEPLYMAHGNNDGIASAKIGASEFATNIPPVARAGNNFTGRPGDTVTLDGSESGDACGDTIASYAWQFVSIPTDSSAILQDHTTSTPSFTMDMPGVYEIQLVVTDSTGLASAPHTVTVSSTNSPPVAYASIDPAALVELGTVVQLDGTDSQDEENDRLSYEWTLIRPWSSAAELKPNASSPTPTFIADVQGEYQARLVVTDSHGATSESVTVTASFDNLLPKADAGTDQSVTVGATVVLDGTDSFDRNGDPLTYEWSFASVPTDSNAQFSDNAAVTEFVADKAGEYIINLVVNDGFADSERADVVTVTAVSAPSLIIQSVQEALEGINELEPQDFRVGVQQRILARRLNIAVSLIEAERYMAARLVLEAVLSTSDGCDERGQPDTGFFPRRDWVVSCEAQEPMYELLTDASEKLIALQ